MMVHEDVDDVAVQTLRQKTSYMTPLHIYRVSQQYDNGQDAFANQLYEQRIVHIQVQYKGNLSYLGVYSLYGELVLLLF